MKQTTTTLLLAIFVLLQSCSKEISFEPQNTAFLQLRLQHTINDQPLQLGATYQNSFEESFTIQKLKYYISNIALFQDEEGVPMPNTYFLVDAAVDSTQTITIPLTPGVYQNFDMMLGVDSARNVSGAQTGALDPLQDMFWTWNTGYIMFKVEGTSAASTAPGNRIQYHIGGFTGPFSALRNVGASLFSPIEVRNGQTLTVTLRADLLRWFDGVHPMPIQAQAVAMSPDAVSARFADNAASMLEITDINVQ